MGEYFAILYVDNNQFQVFIQEEKHPIPFIFLLIQKRSAYPGTLK